MDGFFTPLIRAATYRRWVYLLLGLPLGIFYFTFLVTSLSVGVGLVIIWVGVLILFGAVIAWRGLGHFERRLAEVMIGGEIEAPRPRSAGAGETLWARTRAMLADSYTYRSFFWLLLRFPLGIGGFVIGVVGASVSVSLLVAPVVLVFPETWDVTIAEEVEWLLAVLPLVGIVAAAVTAHVINGFAEVHMTLARWSLGPSARQEVAVQRRRADAAEERTKLAHELHDSVGHTLTRMVVQAGAGGHVYEKDPEFARKALESIEESGRQALGELDRILGLLREDDAGARAPQPGLGGLPDLIDELAEAGLEVGLQVEGSMEQIPQEVSRSAYRIVQEALTNVLKHAGRVPATVSVHRGAGHVELEVLNDAPDDANGSVFQPAESGGRGLIGIEERVGLLGGSVEAGPRPGGGFRVWTRLPVGDR